MNEAHAAIKPMAAKKKIMVSVEMAPELQSVQLDPHKFKQVVSNILSNAVKFTGEGGRINVRATRCSSIEFEVRIQDTGIGIKQEDMDRLFVEFQQLDTGASRTYPGTGLGLALT